MFLLFRLCVHKDTPSYILGRTYTSDSDFFQITFKSGMGRTGTGFMAEYEFIEQGWCIMYTTATIMNVNRTVKGYELGCYYDCKIEW